MVQSSNRAKESKLVSMAAKESNVAIIFGVTGVVGRELAKRLISKPKWKVYGIARKPDQILPIKNPNYYFISCDLLNPFETRQKLSLLQDVTHIFWVTWASQFSLDSEECCDRKKAMISNSLNAILPTAKALKNLSLQRGMKHHSSVIRASFDEKEVCYCDEDCPRMSSSYNFYYVLEDVLKKKLAGKVAWSVHRPGLLMGSSHRTLFHFMGSLCIYGAICKHLNLSFVFGGTKECWEEFCIDGFDSRLVAKQRIWAATTDEVSSTDGQAFNTINGPNFIWKEIWPTLGKKLGLEVPEDMFSEDFQFTSVMTDKKDVWREIVVKEGLIQTEMEELANWVFLDALFRCPVKPLGT